MLDASTTLTVTGKLRVLLPEGSVGYIGGGKTIQKAHYK